MAFSLFDHPHFSALLRHSEIADLFTADAELEAMLRFEAALAEVEADHGVIPKEAAVPIVETIRTFQPAASDLASDVRTDGLVVPGLIRRLREALPPAHRAHVHVDATSQDVIDTGLMLRLKPAFVILKRDLEAVIRSLDDLSAEQGDKKIMGRTRMQRALPITFADRIATWRSPLLSQIEALTMLENSALALQFGGAVGTLDKLGDKGPAVRAALAQRLGLADPGSAWHAERDRIMDVGHWLAKVSGALGKIGQDLALMAQNEVGEAVLASSGGSSAMPHKRNPVRAELLITLARFNAGQIGLLHQAMVHEGERSGAAWSLEWMILPEMVGATAASVMLSKDCLNGLTVVSSD